MKKVIVKIFKWLGLSLIVFILSLMILNQYSIEKYIANITDISELLIH